MKTLPFFIIAFVSLTATSPLIDFSRDQKIAVQNTILTKVNGNTISVIDVKKKMDMIFHQHYPQLADSNQARLQFYEMSWRQILNDMIDHELILSDAADKEVKVTDGEIREIMEERFGPNVIQTLDKIGLTYEETWKMVKNELLVQRMTGWFVHSKAISHVTPQDIRQAYRLYLSQNPPYSEWKYRVVSIRTDHADDMLAERVYQFLAEKNQPPEELAAELKQFEAPGVSLVISNEYQAKTQELSESHKASLASLEPGSYSKPSFQMSRTEKKAIYRISYLAGKTDHPAPAFEDLSQNLRDNLIQKAIAQESQQYLTKLCKHYGFDAVKTLPEDFHPFSLQ